MKKITSKKCQAPRNQRHPLSEQHYKRIICRDRRKAQDLQSVWGVTWSLKGRTFRPLGSTSMMVVSSEHLPGREPTIELRCMTAQLNADRTGIEYVGRMSHDFKKNPRIGARQRTLDPRDQGGKVKAGDRPNGSWVRLALELERCRELALTRNWQLDVIPKMPKFWAAYGDPSEIKFEKTPAFCELLNQELAHTEIVEQLRGEDSRKVDLDQLVRIEMDLWDRLWVPPNAESNESGMWMLPTQFTTQLGRAVKIYEDFSDMVGVRCWNPASQINCVEIDNPAGKFLADAGLDAQQLINNIYEAINNGEAVGRGENDPDNPTLQDLENQIEMQELFSLFSNDAAESIRTELTFEDAARVLVNAAEAEGGDVTESPIEESFDAMVDKLMLVYAEVRASLGSYAECVGSDEMLRAVLNPSEPIIISNPLDYNLPGAEVIRLMRLQLKASRPVVEENVTDEDLLTAAENPGEPLVVSRMCRSQFLFRKTDMSPEHAYAFTSEMLEREGVEANLWLGPDWRPFTQKPESRVKVYVDEQLAST